MLPFHLPCLQRVFYFPSLIFWWWILPSWFLFKFLNFSIPEFPQFTFSSLILFPLLDLEHFYSFPLNICVCVCVFLGFFKWFLHFYFFIFNLHTNHNPPSLPPSNYPHPLPWKNTGSHKESLKPTISSWGRTKTLCIKTEQEITPQNMGSFKGLSSLQTDSELMNFHEFIYFLKFLLLLISSFN